MLRILSNSCRNYTIKSIYRTVIKNHIWKLKVRYYLVIDEVIEARGCSREFILNPIYENTEFAFDDYESISDEEFSSSIKSATSLNSDNKEVVKYLRALFDRIRRRGWNALENEVNSIEDTTIKYFLETLRDKVDYDNLKYYRKHFKQEVKKLITIEKTKFKAIKYIIKSIRTKKPKNEKVKKHLINLVFDKTGEIIKIVDFDDYKDSKILWEIEYASKRFEKRDMSGVLTDEEIEALLY